MKKDIDELSAELNGAAMIVAGLSLQFDEEDAPRLTLGAMNAAMFGVQNYLKRIAADLDNLQKDNLQKGGH